MTRQAKPAIILALIGRKLSSDEQEVIESKHLGHETSDQHLPIKQNRWPSTIDTILSQMQSTIYENTGSSNSHYQTQFDPRQPSTHCARRPNIDTYSVRVGAVREAPTISDPSLNMRYQTKMNTEEDREKMGRK
ncbi:hypothetical protein QBC38DRAFT_521397 [Podospora fimiseda]|uniref:Uncharacterized protein n=1 Tax=Podospora fimiseda TaxID=252190 RepID=A0AAN7BGJ9_9PEZI|nr:hypothetical protein QBC38DRAFT_521397 [Podospora fimiseda]